MTNNKSIKINKKLDFSPIIKKSTPKNIEYLNKVIKIQRIWKSYSKVKKNLRSFKWKEYYYFSSKNIAKNQKLNFIKFCNNQINKIIKYYRKYSKLKIENISNIDNPFNSSNNECTDNNVNNLSNISVYSDLNTSLGFFKSLNPKCENPKCIKKIYKYNNKINDNINIIRIQRKWKYKILSMFLGSVYAVNFYQFLTNLKETNRKKDNDKDSKDNDKDEDIKPFLILKKIRSINSQISKAAKIIQNQYILYKLKNKKFNNIDYKNKSKNNNPSQFLKKTESFNYTRKNNEINNKV